MAFPFTEDNPKAALTDFYAIDSNNRVATTTTDKMQRLSSRIAPSVQRDTPIQFYSLFALEASEMNQLRFTTILNIQTCEYAHFDISKK